MFAVAQEFKVAFEAARDNNLLLKQKDMISSPIKPVDVPLPSVVVDVTSVAKTLENSLSISKVLLTPFDFNPQL